MAIIMLLVLLLILGMELENYMCSKWRGSIKHVIHINGVRGKSTVVRMIDAAFKSNGLKGIAKTTGSEASIVLVDGSVEKIHRKAPVNIREQRKILKRASELQCDYLIIECMAVQPQLQLQSEKMLRADIAVITNVKADHLGVLGYTLEEISNSLLLVKPANGLLITDDYYKKLDYGHDYIKKFYNEDTPFAQNANIALTVCEQLALDIEKSKLAIENYSMDIGHKTYFEFDKGVFVNAFSANDYASTKTILSQFEKTENLNKAIIYNNRTDRPDRQALMLALIIAFNPQKVYIAGSGSYYVMKALKRLDYQGDITRIRRIEDILFEGFITIGIGNIKGFGIDLLRRRFSC
jgi:UDP-N-acetylmuramoylalanine-D-glutamate ligase